MVLYHKLSAETKVHPKSCTVSELLPRPPEVSSNGTHQALQVSITDLYHKGRKYNTA